MCYYGMIQNRHYISDNDNNVMCANIGFEYFGGLF